MQPVASVQPVASAAAQAGGLVVSVGAGAGSRLDVVGAEVNAGVPQSVARLGGSPSELAGPGVTSSLEGTALYGGVKSQASA